jgi:outer membrane protein OmpA-like peptidoglycan-associated protein
VPPATALPAAFLVFHADGQAGPDAGSAPVVDQVRALLATVPAGTVVRITGHSDQNGDEATNLALSQARAQAVHQLVADVRPDLEYQVAGEGEDTLAPSPQVARRTEIVIG